MSSLLFKLGNLFSIVPEWVVSSLGQTHIGLDEGVESYKLGTKDEKNEDFKF